MITFTTRSALFAALLVVSGCFKSDVLGPDGAVVQPLPVGSDIGGDFVLTHSDGQISLDQFSGAPLVIYFGFTQCPDICPSSLSLIKQSLEYVASETNVLFVSLDFVNDTAESSARYAASFGSEFVGAMGTPDEVHAMTKSYRAFYSLTQQSDGSVTVNHASRTFIVNSSGELRYILPHGTDAENISLALQRVR